MASATPTASTILTEVKTLAEKAIAQVLAFGGYYLVLAHTDFSKVETAVGASVTAAIGYIVNRLRGIKL